MGFEEFITETKKVFSRGKYTKEFKITNSFGSYDVYKDMRKNKWYDIGRPVLEKEYYAIIEAMNTLFKEEIACGNDFVLPHGMGIICLKKIKNSVYLKDGKVKATYPIDWNKTLHLWYEDIDAKNRKLLIRNTDIKYSFKAVYNTRGVTFNNRGFFLFEPSRDLKLKIVNNMINDNIEAFK